MSLVLLQFLRDGRLTALLVYLPRELRIDAWQNKPDRSIVPARQHSFVWFGFKSEVNHTVRARGNRETRGTCA
jgi:hypothetical protein